ncbi:MAG: 4-hydroxy-tetrahydrodipicolinate reductase [Candidatus Tokpelaia sp. JSC085]|nr:MAG: 4-hydroxy-tetrahydrodipicolinate reductase [Candidatus Tokpelaia sp. JSC085]
MRLAVVGANGHMGRELIRTVIETDHVELAAVLVRSGSIWLGKDAGTLAGTELLGIEVTDNPCLALEKVDGILDFTRPEASIAYVSYAVQASLVHVIGTTGFSDEQERVIAHAARDITIIKSGNMSLGINLLAGFASRAAPTLLAEDFDIEILEMHHRRKVDAPSGTALFLGKSVAQNCNIDLEKEGLCIHHGDTGERQKGTIGFASLRGGTVAGEHSVVFAGEGERIILSHIAEDRSIFARGAIKAALWARDKPHGLYSMLNVLGLID